MQPISDSEVIKVMVDGGERLCDHALTQWINDAYKLSEDVRQENITRWNALRRRIRDVAKLIVITEDKHA